MTQNVWRTSKTELLKVGSHDSFENITVVTRSQDSNGMTQLAQAMQNLNWTPIYSMQSCEMVS